MELVAGGIRNEQSSRVGRGINEAVTFNVLDDFNREGLCIEVDFSLPAERVVRSLNQIIEWHGQPQTVRVDNCPE